MLASQEHYEQQILAGYSWASDNQAFIEAATAAMRLSHATATAKGWYTNPYTGQPKARNFGEVLMLMVSELAEARKPTAKT